jgi:hypothetical protein
VLYALQPVILGDVCGGVRCVWAHLSSLTNRQILTVDVTKKLSRSGVDKLLSRAGRICDFGLRAKSASLPFGPKKTKYPSQFSLRTGFRVLTHYRPTSPFDSRRS